MTPQAIQMVQAVAKELGVDAKTALLLLERETGGHPDPLTATSEAGARGPLQVMPATGADLASKHGFDFETPEGQTRAGLIYYKDLMGRFDNDPATAAAAYHSGPTRVRGIIDRGGDLATDLGPVGQDYYQWFKDRTTGQDTEAVPGATSEEYPGTVVGEETTPAVVPGEEVFPGEEVAGSEALSKVEGISALPEHDRNIKLSSVMGPTMGGAELPFSKADLAGLLPMIGGSVGAMLGNAPGAAVGAGSGEAVRQLLRRAMGAPQATGFIQSTTGMDPDNPLAAAAGIGAEAAGAGVVDKVAGALGKTNFAKTLRDRAASMYAGMFPETAFADQAKHAETLAPILDQLPAGGRKKMHRIAGINAKTSGKEVQDVYDSDIESSFEPVIDKLREGAKAEQETAAGWVYARNADGSLMKDAEGKVIKEFHKAQSRNPGRTKAFTNRSKTLDKAQFVRENVDDATGRINIRDLFQRRKAARDQMNQISFDKMAKDLTPPQLALKTERQAFSDTLHTPHGDWTKEMADEAKIVDSIHSAWETVKSGTKGLDSNFIARWVAARAVPGKVGTIAGAFANQPSFWRSHSAKKLLQLDRFIKEGKHQEASQLFRGMVSTFANGGEEEE